MTTRACNQPALSLLLLGGCPGTAPETPVTAESTIAEPTTVAETSATGDTTTSANETTLGPNTTTADSTSSASETTGTTTAMTLSETGMPPEPRLCSLEELDPSADVAAAVDEGNGAGQIPTIIGDALVRNCGCHYTDEMLPPGVVDYQADLVQLRTLADFQVEFAGTIPMGFEGMPTYAAVRERVVNMQPLPMPSIMCDVEGENGTITMADLTLFTEWLDAGVPDGASFP